MSADMDPETAREDLAGAGNAVTRLCPACLHDGVLERTLDRALAAERKLATITSHCRGHLELPGSCCPHLAQEILAITGTGPEDRSDEGADHG
jgi:hypothetical protein